MGGSSQTFSKNSERTFKNSSSSTKKIKKLVYKEDDEDYEEGGGFKKIITKTKVTTIIKNGRKKHKGRYVEVDEENGDENYEGGESESGVFVMYESNAMDIRYRIPKPAVCMTWNGNKVKTFDGLTYTSNLYCAHTLVQDAVDGSFSVVLRSCPYYSEQNYGLCKSPALVLFLQNARYTFEVLGNWLQFQYHKQYKSFYLSRWICASTDGRSPIAYTDSKTGHSCFHVGPQTKGCYGRSRIGSSLGHRSDGYHRSDRPAVE